MWNESPYGVTSSFTGGILWGDKLAKFIYTDEAGYEDTAPRTVVAGVIVDADRQLLLAERAIEEVLRGIPQHLRGDNAISVKSLFGHARYKEGWSFASRKRLILNLMSVARKCGIPVAYSVIDRGAMPWPDTGRFTIAQVDHLLAISMFAARVDKAIRDHCPANEIGMLIYEDMDHFREKIEMAVNHYRETPAHLLEEHLNKTEDEKRLGYFFQEGEMIVERIRQRVLFMKKGDDPLLLLADAAAFAVRRYYNGEDFGEEFIEALLGNRPNLKDHESGLSAKVNYF